MSEQRRAPINCAGCGRPLEGTVNVLFQLCKQRGRALLRDEPRSFRLCGGCIRKYKIQELVETT
jgi:hypothetical protein